MVVAISDRPYGTLSIAVDHKPTVYAPDGRAPSSESGEEN